MWQYQSPPEQGGRVQSRVTYGSTGTLPNRETGSKAVGHVAETGFGGIGHVTVSMTVRRCTPFSLSWFEGGVAGLQIPTDYTGTFTEA
jgi:hypothetical protein